MKKYGLLLLLLTANLFGASAAFEPFAKWMLFTADFSYIDNVVNKKIHFDGGQEVTAVVEDNAGKKIIAVAGKGVFVFDGKQMQLQKMPADCFAATADIISMACDSKNTIWIGTTAGLVKFEGGAFTNIPRESTNLQIVTDIVITASDKVYISGMVMGEKTYVGGGLSFFNGTGWTNYNKGNADMPDNLLSELTLDNNGHLWAIAGKDLGVAKFDGKNWKHFTNANGLSTNTINAIATNKSGKVWLGAPKGIMEYDGATFTMKPFSNGFSPRMADITARTSDGSIELSSLAVEDNGTIWIGTKSSGVYSFAHGGLKILNQQNSPINNNAVLHITIDKSGHKWIIAGYKTVDYAIYAPNDVKNRTHTTYTSNYGGLTVYREHNMVTDPKWTVYDSATNAMDFGGIYAIDEDKQNNIWMASSGEGLVNAKGGVFTNYKHPKVLETAFTGLFLAPDNKIFLSASYGGVKVFDNGAITDYAKNPNMGGVTDMTYDKNNTLWTCGSGGISHYTNNDWETFNKKDGLPSIIFYSIIKDSKNTLWAGSAKGLVKYDTAWTKVGEDVDFPSDNFTTLAEDSKGRLILGTNKGISIYDGTTFTNIPEIESLKIKKFRVNQICVDKNNVAWIATENYGVLRYDGTNWSQYSKNTTGGMYDKVTAIKMASDGKLYVASETSTFNEFDVNLPNQSQEEMMRQEIARKIKLAEPRYVLTVIQH